jgi:hypothetical protein
MINKYDKKQENNQSYFIKSRILRTTRAEILNRMNHSIFD